MTTLARAERVQVLEREETPRDGPRRRSREGRGKPASRSGVGNGARIEEAAYSSMEGISDRRRRSLFTGVAEDSVSAFTNEPDARESAAGSHGEATGVSEVRSRRFAAGKRTPPAQKKSTDPPKRAAVS